MHVISHIHSTLQYLPQKTDCTKNRGLDTHLAYHETTTVISTFLLQFATAKDLAQNIKLSFQLPHAPALISIVIYT